MIGFVAAVIDGELLTVVIGFVCSYNNGFLIIAINNFKSWRPGAKCFVNFAGALVPMFSVVFGNLLNSFGDPSSNFNEAVRK